MSDSEIRKKFEEFISDYKEYFMSNEEIWGVTLNTIIEYIRLNKKRPSRDDIDKEIQSLGRWIHNQQFNYRKNKEIMAQPEIRKMWEKFVNDHKNYFILDDKIWVKTWSEMLDKAKLYIDTNQKKPPQHDKNKDIRSLAIWIYNQQAKYKKEEKLMKQKEIRKKWEDFIEEYGKYL
jgi:hypothetical protein